MDQLHSVNEELDSIESARELFIQQLLDGIYHPTRYDPIISLDLCNYEINCETARFDICLILTCFKPSETILQLGYEAKIERSNNGGYRVLSVKPSGRRFRPEILRGLDGHANNPDFVKRLFQNISDNKLLNKKITNIALAQIEARFPLLGNRFETPIDSYSLCV